ncbi:MAG: formylmethanofuran dehydrogenase subunit C [Azospirillum sp.]|nr:formylmethanofuran dehydrogenase subunit C [Azospirillum sp.]
MTGWRLVLKQPTGPRIDMAPVLPQRLSALAAAEIRALPLTCGNRLRPLGALFDEEPGDQSGDGPTLAIGAATARLDNLGRDMAGGTLAVEGDTGAFLGRRMAGGTITVTGSCGAHAAAGMTGGTLRVAGSAGDFLGAPAVGEVTGMAGGLVVIGGDAGDRVGERLRRGSILIGGGAGAYCGVAMIAGTIAVAGICGDGPGFAMRRGSIILGTVPKRLPVGFADSGRYSLPFLPLLRRHLARHAAWLAGSGGADRWLGDLTAGGRGEILCLDRD